MQRLEVGTGKIIAWTEGATAWLVFNQPEKRNAISLEMWRGIARAFEQFDTNNDIRVVVLRGAGGQAFVAGADISEFDTARANAEQRRQYGEIAAAANRWLNGFEKPVIALIEGICIGGGLATALTADIRIATPDTRFGIPAGRLGLGYEYGGVAKLARTVGPANARDILLSARYFGADEALQMGLVNFIRERGEIEAFTAEYAAQIATRAPLTLKAAKAAVNAFERGGQPDDVAHVAALVDACFNSEDYKEGRRAFRDKRTPEFRGS